MHKLLSFFFLCPLVSELDVFRIAHKIRICAMILTIVKHKIDHFVPKSIEIISNPSYFIFLYFFFFHRTHSHLGNQIEINIFHFKCYICLKHQTFFKKTSLLFSFSLQSFSCVCLFLPFVFIATVDNIETVRVEHFSALFTLDSYF